MRPMYRKCCFKGRKGGEEESCRGGGSAMRSMYSKCCCKRRNGGEDESFDVQNFSCKNDRRGSKYIS